MTSKTLDDLTVTKYDQSRFYDPQKGTKGNCLQAALATAPQPGAEK